MSKNYKEIESYKYLKGLTNKVSIKLIKKWNRHNWDVGEFRALRKEKLEKIIDKETNLEINSY
jgi:hypothetical protein